ncbi:hypothetical protein [Enterobacter sp. 638]|uniref:Lipoprotein n=1 Tax=Enterobacter sp. (strain 638) TaxID=399742 RepID=A0A9J9KYZ8_ENT38|nr:hypothetical protein [Enterobacter sp. 638]ABP61273.1 putative lipoprotein [Enterobacter sp. 638]
MRLITALFVTLLLTGCTNYSAHQPYRSSNGEQMLISANIPNGMLKLWVNDVLVVDDTILNQDKSLSAAFSQSYTNVYHGTYRGQKIMTRCKFSRDAKECDVFVDGEYAANLFLR